MKKSASNILVFLTALSLLFSGCSSAGSPAANETDLQGTISVSGAWALYPLMVRWGEEFQKRHPAVRFDISAGGAGKGMADALAGAVDIGMVSRNIYPEEIEKGAFWVSVTRDAVFLTVNQQNPVWEDIRQRGITQQMLMGIYITGEITTWGQVVERPEVIEPIHVFTRSDAAGAPETWAQFLGKRQEDLLGIGVYGDPGVLDAVIKDRLAVGFNNLTYAYSFDTGLPMAGVLVAPIDVNGNGIADPEEVVDTKEQAIAAVSNGHYPSPPARDLNVVTHGPPSGLVQTFIVWVLTEGQQYVDEVGYIPLPQETLDAQLEKLKGTKP